MLQEYDWHHLRLRLRVYKGMVINDHKGIEINGMYFSKRNY